MAENDEKQTVLIVEDEAVSRRALTALLSLNGYNAWSVPSAEEALEMVQSGEVPHVALVDLDLPGMNGMDLIANLMKLHPDIVPVLITATSRERIEWMNKDSQLQYIRKPIDLGFLMRVIDQQRAS